MQVFKTFFLIAKHHITTAIIFSVIFVVIAISMPMSSENDANFKATSLKICVFDNDKSQSSKALIKYLEKYHEITTDVNDVDDTYLQDCLYYAKYQYILTINEGYEEKITRGDFDNLLTHSTLADNMSTVYATQQIDRYISAIKMYTTGGFSLAQSLDKASTLYDNNDFVTKQDFNGNSTKNINYDMFSYFRYLPYIMISVFLACLTPILISFKHKDIGKRIACSSLKPASKTIQLIAACFIYSISIWGVFMITCMIIYSPKNFFSKLGLMSCANSAVFLVFVIALTLFISCFDISKNTISIISNVIGLGMSFLCGIFVPQSYLGSKVLSFSRFLPAYWYVKCNDMLAGFSSDTMSDNTFFTCIGIQLIFCLLFIVLFVAFSQNRRKAS
ncbi:MAG: ABC transporter permease [Lachnospiraceae bacterium]|nr:ABC transporter permease [Lachnospiraceae bacterium]